MSYAVVWIAPSVAAVARVGIDERAKAKHVVAVVVENLIGLLRDAVVLERHSLLLHERERGKCPTP